VSTQPSAQSKASSRYARPVGWVRDLPIWTKLGLIMIVPTIATIVVGSVGLLDQVQQANNAERARTLAVLSGEAGNLVHRLQSERASAVTLLKAPAGDVDRLKSEYTKQQQTVDAANARYRLSRSTLADIPDNLRALLNGIETGLGELPVLRADVEALTKVPLSTTESRYQVLVADLLQIRELSAQLTGDTTLTDRMRTAAAVATDKEFLSQERVVIIEAMAEGKLTEAARLRYITTLAGQALALNTFNGVATNDQKELLNQTSSGQAVRDLLFMQGQLANSEVGGNLNNLIKADDWNSTLAARAEQLSTVEMALNDQARTAATDLGDKVQRRVLIETGLLLLTLLLGVLFAWLVARSMARSLRDLRQGALAVAQYGLPQAVARLRDPALSTHLSPAGVAMQIAEPLPVRSKDEFGQVTEAFNAVHLEAVRTAAEQAALRSSVATMFVNLARRSQILVDRLIGHLDRLERGEQDPDRLSELFQLDHLATRMRRNDENLLVLAGADSTRIQREPAALMDVLRASQSEVEHYTRIEFTAMDQDIEIAAHAVNDLVHLVAELFDNATAFSAPDTRISVEARRVGDRAVLQVEDRGIGMSPEQYAELNERLATPPMVDVAVSRMMGLVVVARLAARHGVKVELRQAPERGTIAEVLLPSGVLVPRALAGRTHAPVGFPAARQVPGVPTSSLFAPPLALESASSGPFGPTGWGQEESWGGARRPPASPLAPPPLNQVLTSVPGHTAGPPTFTPPTFPPTPMAPPSGPPGSGPPNSGLGAALADGGISGVHVNPGGLPGTNGYSTTNGGRPLPAWFDLTGATGVTDAPATGAPSDIDPLPHRRPGQWDEPEPDLPPRPGEGFRSGPSGFSGPPSAGRPPAWPPVAEPDMPGIPEGLSASLDMTSTSEIPRVRGSAPTEAPEDTGPYRYADDMTMELPIFSELESAWFRPPPVPSQPTPASTPDSYDSPAVQRSEWTTGSDGAMDASDEVSWRSVADDGWLAAQAATEPVDGGSTEMGLPRRVPMAQLVPGGVETVAGGAVQRESAVAPDRRSPDSVRGLLSAYHRGVQRGRDAHGKEADPTGSPTNGREQDA
jgi:signal transduction histidine kinase